MVTFYFLRKNFFLFLLPLFFLFSCDKKKLDTDGKRIVKTDLSSEDLEAKEKMLELLQTEMFFSDATQLGAEKANSTEVKEFSEKAFNKHSEIYDKIKVICEERGYPITNKNSKELNDQLYKLTVVNANDFDAFYLKSLADIYKLTINNLAIDINNDKYPNESSILLEVVNNYNKNLDKMDKLK